MDEEAHLKKMKLLGDLDYEEVRRQVKFRKLSVNTVVTFSRKYFKSYYTYEIDRTTRIEVTILNMAIRFSDEEFVDYLLTKKADVSLSTKDMGPVIFSAVHMRNLKFLKKLVAAGANVNQKRYDSAVFRMNYTPLEMAAEMNAQDIVVFLVKKGATVNNQEEIFPASLPLLAALKYDNAPMVKLLVDIGANINKITVNKGRVNFPLKACTTNRTTLKQVMEILLRNPMIKLDTRDETNRTGLHWAMDRGNKVALQKLLDAGCDVNLPDRKNKLPIDVKNSLEIGDDSCLLILQQHIVKLMIAGFYVSQRNLSAVSKGFDYFRDKCAVEVQLMKNTRDLATGFRCFELLKAPMFQIARNISQWAFTDQDLERLGMDFPVYGKMMVYRLARAKNLKNLMAAAQITLSNVFTDLPDSFIEMLVKYFSPEELFLITGW